MKWNNLFKKSTDAQNWTFRTNIMCNGCIAKITPILDNAQGIASWQVDLKSPDRLLTVTPDGITEADLLAIVRAAGFTIERVK